MNNKQLKELAKWAGFKIYYFNNDYKTPKVYFYGEEFAPEKWQPHKDSNQLDMLEDKMIKESNIISAGFQSMIDYWTAWYYDPINPITKGDGKTKNEARLNAILNYLKEKK